MAKIAKLLIELQGNASLIDRCKIVGVQDEETHIWKLSDGTSIVIQAKKTVTDRHRPSVYQTAEKIVDQPFKVVVARVKRRYKQLRKEVEVQPCLI